MNTLSSFSSIHIDSDDSDIEETKMKDESNSKTPVIIESDSEDSYYR